MARNRYPSTAHEMIEAATLLPDEEWAKLLDYFRALVIKHAIITEEERQTFLRRAVEAALADGTMNFETGTDIYRDWYHERQKNERHTSKPEIIRRNAELIEKRERGRSVRALSKDHNLSKRSVEEILKNKLHWKLKAANLKAMSGD